MWNSPTLSFDGWASAWKAPSSASSETRRPVMVPSALSAISPRIQKSRANPVEIRFSLRSSIHLTGCPSRSEAAVATTYPGYTGTLLPNPPPMSGETIRIFSSGRPATSANTVRISCGAWEVM